MPADVEKLWRELEWDVPVPKAPKKKAAARKALPAVVAVPSAAEKKAKRDAKYAKKRRSWWRRKQMQQRVKKRWAEIGRLIAAEFERERQKLLVEALKKQKEYDLELVLIAAEEKRQAEVKTYYTECQRQAAAYIEKLRKAAA